MNLNIFNKPQKYTFNVSFRKRTFNSENIYSTIHTKKIRQCKQKLMLSFTKSLTIDYITYGMYNIDEMHFISRLSHILFELIGK